MYQNIKKKLNSLFQKNNNKSQKYFIIYNIFFIFLLIMLNLKPELIFIKVPLQVSSMVFWNNLFSSVLLINILYFIIDRRLEAAI
jgi:hypothetical protein